MKKVLIVEDSSMVIKVIKHVVAQSSQFIPLYAESFTEAKILIEREGDIFASMVDLSLPDAPNGEIVDFTLAQKMPTIVLTGSFDNERRESLLAKGVVDYVTKEGRFSYLFACNLINRLIKNEKISVLVVDDSSMSRKIIVNLMKLHRYNVFEAKDGVEAIEVILQNPNIKMLITDYNMPKMDGFELVQNLRVKYGRSELVIIGISSEGDGNLTARFIKAGANDFIKKPFNHEEFFCRVTQDVEQIEMIEQIRDAARRDYHTGVYNRYYFFERGLSDFDSAQQAGVPTAMAIIDIDNFRLVNDTYGNEVGDSVTQQFAHHLENLLDRFLVARADGQEFYVLMVGLSNEKAVTLVQGIANFIANEPICLNQQKIPVRFSAGVSNLTSGSSESPFDNMIYNAYQCLGRAKDAGGDMIIGDDALMESDTP